MFATLIRKVIGSQNDRHLKRMSKVVHSINLLEETLQQLDDHQLQSKTAEFRQRIQEGAKLESVLVEAFAVCREASHRVLNMRHFDVQLIGGITLHEGRIAEMRTGEGKTLVATLAAYLNALSGHGVHIITVNDYLATRDAQWMRPLYEFLGLTVGTIVSQQDFEEKKKAYQADITYGTNNEFGFDYLRDNMAFSINDKFQRSLKYAIIDEVDSILIDEARTPLIISGPSDESSELYQKINRIVPSLKQQIGEGENIEKPGDYIVDEKQRQVELTEDGHQLIETLLTKEKLLQENESLYFSHNLTLLHHTLAALKAHVLFHQNVEYIISNNEIVLIDEHTGRKMPGRRLSDGLHQAIEAKENLPIQAETQTLASTTFQNYFRLYDKLSGMTGTADTEAYEMHEIYHLDVVVIPTHKPVNRIDYPDFVFLSLEKKYKAIIHDIKEQVANNRPVLVGTASVESSELLSNVLKKEKIPHEVLNAKFHEREAEIIAQAGAPKAITIATNMAGRGTDIILGGHYEAEISQLKNPTEKIINKIKSEWQKKNKMVIDAGGLHIIGTERHESRRIDNQLRGRSGRQGDPGSSRFYLSLDDNLMRIFLSERIKNFMQSMDDDEGVIESRMVSKSIEKAQKKVEGRNFDIRKQLLEYDDVANAQRLIVYEQRNQILEADNLEKNIQDMRHDVVNDLVEKYIPPMSMEEQWDIAGLEKVLLEDFQASLNLQKWIQEHSQIENSDIIDHIIKNLEEDYQKKEELVGQEALRSYEKNIFLYTLDEKWKEHLSTMDHLRQGIHLRGYAARNPKDEYKREAYNLFSSLLYSVRHDVIKQLSTVHIQSSIDAAEAQRHINYDKMLQNMQFQHDDLSSIDTDESSAKQPQEPFARQGRKIGRNELCPCNSGKKYKQCHGKIQ